MTQEQWDNMSNQEKFNYLDSHNPTVNSQPVMDSSCKVGDPNAIKTHFVVTRGLVQTGAGYSLSEAVSEDEQFMATLKDGL